MALVRDLIFKKPPTTLQRIIAERNRLNLKALKKVTVQFDPFREDVQDIRRYANLMYAKRTLSSNPKCVVKTEILTDRSEHNIHFELLDGKVFVFKCANLKLLEIFQLMNRYITPLAPKEEEAVDSKKPAPKMGRKK